MVIEQDCPPTHRRVRTAYHHLPHGPQKVRKRYAKGTQCVLTGSLFIKQSPGEFGIALEISRPNGNQSRIVNQRGGDDQPVLRVAVMLRQIDGKTCYLRCNRK